MNVLIQRSWDEMLRSEIESSMRQKTLMLASRITITPPDQRSQVIQQAAAEAAARATLIATDGTVLADSDVNPAQMENHADRPEVIEALHGGVGLSTRSSHSLGIPFMYTAAPVPG